MSILAHIVMACALGAIVTASVERNYTTIMWAGCTLIWVIQYLIK